MAKHMFNKSKMYLQPRNIGQGQISINEVYFPWTFIFTYSQCIPTPTHIYYKHPEPWNKLYTHLKTGPMGGQQDQLEGQSGRHFSDGQDQSLQKLGCQLQKTVPTPYSWRYILDGTGERKLHSR